MVIQITMERMGTQQALQENMNPWKLRPTATLQGHSDYLSFIQSCARYGVEKWIVSIEKMSCTYCDKAGNEMLIEQIPQ